MRRSNLILCSALASLLLVAWGAWNANADVSSADKIEGTWLMTIIPSPGSPVPPFQVLQTFNTGNTITQTGALQHPHTADGPLGGIIPFNFSDIYGTWEKELGNTYNLTLLNLIFDPTTREHVGFFRVHASLVVEGDTLTGESTNETILGPPGLPDPDTGTPVNEGESEFVGRRIRVE